jgi:hypothetical protein
MPLHEFLQSKIEEAHGFYSNGNKLLNEQKYPEAMEFFRQRIELIKNLKNDVENLKVQEGFEVPLLLELNLDNLNREAIRALADDPAENDYNFMWTTFYISLREENTDGIEPLLTAYLLKQIS